MRISGFSAVLGAAVALLAVAPASAQLTLTSPDFEEGAAIEMANSAYGDNISPILNWSGAPSGTRSYALVLFDTDVPMEGGFVHWVAYNIPASATGLPGGLPAGETLSEPASIAGTVQGLSGLNRSAYFGPRPPSGSGVHHYNFELLALDIEPNLATGLNRDALMEAIDGHILDRTILLGIYQVK